MVVREMILEDIRTVAKLCGQLGFDADENELYARLVRMRRNEGHRCFVADVAEEKTVGWVHVYDAPSLLSESTAEVGGMVVDCRHRRKGIGTLLMQRAEAWAFEHGCASMLLATQINRKAARHFYESLGYEEKFSTYFLRKALIK